MEFTLMQDIRRDLLRGRFHDYCLQSPACPIVRKSIQAHTLPLWQRALIRGRHIWWRVNTNPDSLPNRAWWRTKWLAIRARRALTEPAYVKLHLGRTFNRVFGRRPGD